MEDKLDKIIDLLVAQNNLLTSIMISLKSSGVASSAAPSWPNVPNNTGINIRDEIERKIAQARAEAQSKLNQVQTMPEIKSLMKTE
jgi:hypothetical protein